MGSSSHASGPCHRCGRGGHLARECNLHICFRCNGRGHMAWECVEGVTCSRCGEKGHFQRNCKNVSCHKCGRKGHISKFCNDPFIKAEEAERNERQQALLKARNLSGHSLAKAVVSPQTKAFATLTGNQSGVRGPWDGLGNPGHETTLGGMCTSRRGVTIDKIATNRSQGGLIKKVKILTVKRKIYPEANIERAKRGAHEGSADHVDRDFIKDKEPAQWIGLVGYGSSDSGNENYTSSDVDNEGQHSSFEKVTHFETKPTVG